MRPFVLWAAIVLVVATALITAMFYRDMSRAYKRVAGDGAVISSPFGEIEFAEGGSGPDVLVIQGSGGGYDQCKLIAHAVLGDGYHWIAPSRFGYLRSSLPENATWDDQADAYARLLDYLGVEKAAAPFVLLQRYVSKTNTGLSMMMRLPPC